MTHRQTQSTTMTTLYIKEKGMRIMRRDIQNKASNLFNRKQIRKSRINYTESKEISEKKKFLPI